MTERKLPPDFFVEDRGAGDERHVCLIIEGCLFELHPGDALPLGEELVRVAKAVAGAEESPT